ncbi:MAG TPA: adenosylcobinamide-GDP ribazoletransferase [Thermodesulfovibrionales bacterium]|nr:adenosylcobinamide-GDP ribazoletransferase [Thermodesulfovibrionales bacterium]
MRQLAVAFQFLTIIPIKVRGDVSARDLSRSAVFFPVVGAFQGLLAACASSLFIMMFPSEITSGLIIVVLVISNGGFHLDGLADTFDALAVKSSGNEAIDIEKRLSVMKEGTTGAIGVVSIVLVILLKYLFINDLLLKASTLAAASFLFLMAVFSRWVMVPSLCHGTSARKDGLGKAFMDSVGMSTVMYSFLLVVLFCSFIVWLSLSGYGTKAFALYLFLSALLYLFSVLAVGFFKRKFGGLTGDNFGAISEISEILFLMGVSLWLQRFI